jgi:hypothetical protein
MKRRQEPMETRVDQQAPREWIHLIRKLRWMGLADDARFLELAVSTLPSKYRDSVPVGPFTTD